MICGMCTAYTVDRLARLAAGATLDRTIRRTIQPQCLQTHVDSLFPRGVTEHGNGYFLSGNQPATAVSANIELLFEYVRRSHYPGAPSRFDSVFACETLADAQLFRSAPGWGSTAAPIWELEAIATPFRADMTCLTLQGSILIASYVAHRYWNQQDNDFVSLGGASTSPFWELLLSPPVKVVRRVV
jgi:hypothetical protein